MSQSNIISVRGLSYLHPDIFDGLVTPTFTDEDGTIVTLDKQMVIFAITRRCAELELVYPSAAYMKDAITEWSYENQIGWNKAWKALNEKYDPLWNKDGWVKEKSKETRDLANSDIYSGSDTEERNYTDTTNYNSNVETQVSAYNENGYQPKERQVNGGNDQTVQGGSGTTNYGQHRDGTDSGTVTNEYERREYGNIGVTMAQDMLKAELSIANENMVKIITESFKDEFCIKIW